MKYYELSLIVGKSATEIESTWSLTDVNYALMVYRAQQEARIAIANKNKVSLADIPLPMSCDLRKEFGD